MPLRITGIFMLLLCLTGGAVAQTHLPFTPEEEPKTSLLEPWIAPAVGFVPSNNALRVSVITGNLLLDRLGGYVAIEKGLDTSYFTNIYGATVTVTRHIYMWGGMDLFTQRGVIHSLKGARKELGIGFLPWRDLVATAGWSKAVGFTFSLGWKFSLVKTGGEE